MERDNFRNLLIFCVLTAVVLIGWNYLFPPPKPAPQPATPEVSEPTAEPGSLLPEPQPEAAPTESGEAELDEPVAEEGDEATPYEKIVGEAGQASIVVEVPHQRVSFSAKGARVLSWELLDFPQDPSSKGGRALDLVSPVARAIEQEPLAIFTGDPELDERLANAWYQVETGAPTEAERKRLGLGDSASKVEFVYADGRGLEARKSLIIRGENYLTHVAWSLTQGDRDITSSIVWGPGITRAQTEGSRFARAVPHGTVSVALPESIETLNPGDVDSDQSWQLGPRPRWLALQAQHFAVAMIFSEPPASILRVFDTSGLGPANKDAAEVQKLGIATTAREFALFTGPKDDRLLREVDTALGVDVSKLIDWGFFGFFAEGLYKVLRWLQGYVVNWGLAIVILTLAIRLAFFPILHRSMIKMKATQQQMAKLQPKLRHIKEKYRGVKDAEGRRKMHEESMALYKKEGVNPMASLSGCLPMLLQLPVLWAMYRMLLVAPELRGAPFFGWIHDLSAADPFYVTPIVMGASMLLQQLLSMTKTTDPQQRSQQRMMLIMPIMFTWMFLSLPSGLVLYWLTSNLLGIVQQLFVNKSAKAATA